ncbi:MAG: response regulator [Gemmatimonadetes bacterium]|nr:response regulator [Gemmatimonadota bacterium]
MNPETRSATPPAPAAAAPPAEVMVVIDDDYAMRLSCRQILTKMGYRVEVFEDGAAGLDGVARSKPPLVVVDLKMPGISGQEVIARVHELDPEIVIIVITGYATIATAVEAMKSGAYDFLPKPFTPDELRLIVGRGLERRRLQQEARRLQLERELLKRKFITFVSHQLKTPLVAIHQYLDVLLRLGDSPTAAEKRDEWLGRCIKRTEEMQDLIRDWLTLAQAEGGALTRHREPVDLGHLLQQIALTYEGLVSSSELALQCAIEPGALVVQADRQALSVLFDNLITNAIKYNRPGGSITVYGGEDAGEIRVSVTDTGYGIPEDARPYLFDEFFRVGGTAAPRTSGTGLGLPICRRIVTELGGTIEVTSETGSGSTFTVRLPVGSATPPQPGAQG